MEVRHHTGGGDALSTPNYSFEWPGSNPFQALDDMLEQMIAYLTASPEASVATLWPETLDRFEVVLYLPMLSSRTPLHSVGYTWPRLSRKAAAEVVRSLRDRMMWALREHLQSGLPLMEALSHAPPKRPWHGAKPMFVPDAPPA